MAGAGYKLFQTGDVLTAAQVNTYLNEQTVMVFANAAARTSALTSVLAEGMVSYLQDTNAVEVYNGSAWVGVSGTGDLTEIVAGTGITVTSGTGPIPTVALTTPVAATNGGTAQSTYATGDLLYASASNTLAKRAIGSTGNVLTVAGGIPTWAAPGAPAFVGASGFRNSSFTVADSTDTYVAFPDTDEYDTDAIHDPASNNTRFTIPTGKTGYWLLQFSPMTTGHTSAFSNRSLVRINGSTKIYRHSMLIPANSGEYDIYFSKVVKLTAGDYVEFAVWQNSGGTRTYYCAVNAGEKQGMATVSYLGA